MDQFSRGQMIKACSPFIFLTIMIVAWGIKPVKQLLDSVGEIQFLFPGLHNTITDMNGKLIPHVFHFNYLSAAGTAIIISCIISIPVLGISYRRGLRIFISTIKSLRYPIVTIGCILGFASLLNDSGMISTLAKGLAGTGYLFPFFAPVLGWLGVFITGSDTSSNALFGNLQAVTARSLGVNPVVTVAANASGGVMGKMISPSSIAVAAAAGNLVGKESQLFRFTLKHSFIMLFVVCLITTAQCYLFTWMAPEETVVSSGTLAASPVMIKGWILLLLFAVIICALIILIRQMNKPKPLGTLPEIAGKCK
jgi:lactate permease